MDRLSRKRPDANEAVRVRFEPATVQALKDLADRHGLTLPPLVFALYLTWLWRMSGQDELVVGYPYAGRDVPWALEKIHRCPASSIWRVGLSWASSVCLSSRMRGRGTSPVAWS